MRPHTRTQHIRMVSKLTAKELKGRTVLLRSDLNSDFVHGVLYPGERIKAAAETIIYLQKKGAKVVIIAHQGNPHKSDFASLAQHAQALKKHITHLTFTPHVCNEKAVDAIKALKNGEALLLENVRFEADEFAPTKKKNRLIESLAPLADYYVNDAFSVCHRAHTSIVSFPRHLPAYAGLLIERELQALKKISLKGALYILGGSKPESNIKLLKKNRTILAGGLFGQTCVVARGHDLGFQNKYLEEDTLTKESYSEFLQKLKKKITNVITPVDFAVNKNNTRTTYTLAEFPRPERIDDIGERTIAMFTKEIERAKVIYMKGPLGYTGDKQFSTGTHSILKAIAKSRAYSLIGGGHLSDEIAKAHITKEKFNHISLSGGALLSFIAGETLPGLAALGYT